MACNCMEKTLEKAGEQLRGKIRGDIVPDSFKAKWRNEVYRIGKGVGIEVVLMVDSEVRLLKKDQTPAKNLTKDSLYVAMSHCPLCGTKIERGQG